MGYEDDFGLLIFLVIVLPIICGLWVISVSVLLCKKCCFRTQTPGIVLNPPPPVASVFLEMQSHHSSSVAAPTATTMTPAARTGPVTSPSPTAAATDNTQTGAYAATFQGPSPYQAASKPPS